MNVLNFLRADGKKPDDILSPILIKELRQGMRARAFVISFLLLQVFLILLVLGNLAAENDRNALESQDWFFWGIISMALLGLMPLRGLNAISQELRHNTIETILLTRLTAWRVVFGKWSALFAQSLLFVTAVLPYLVLRYFIGGDDVVADFGWLLLLLWFSGILIAAAIAASALANIVARIILVLAGVWIVGVGTGGLFFSASAPFNYNHAWEVLGWLLIYGFFIPALLFEMSASTIAPASENHAFRRRLFALGFAGSALLLAICAGKGASAECRLPVFILFGICYFELAEKPKLLSRLILPLSRGGLLGRIAGIFFLPGWPSALLFSLIVVPAALCGSQVLAHGYGSSYTWVFPLYIYAVLGSVLVPALICHLFWPRLKQVLLMIVLYNIALVGITSVLKGFASLMNNSGIDEAMAFAPSIPVLMINELANESSEPVQLWYLIINGLVIAILVIALLVASRSYFRDLFTLFRSEENISAVDPKKETPVQ